MRPTDRHKWILDWLTGHKYADVLDAEFVDAYIAATGARYRPTTWGAYKCPQLGRDLTAMFDTHQLDRRRTGLGGNWQPGFPRWVWVYEKFDKVAQTF